MQKLNQVYKVLSLYEAHLFSDFLSSSLYLLSSLSIRSRQALPVTSTGLSSELKAWLRIRAITSQSAGEFGLLATTSVASWRLFEVVGHLNGAIFLSNQEYYILFIVQGHCFFLKSGIKRTKN